MGKFLDIINKENKRMCPEIEAALEKAWFRRAKHPGCWEREFRKSPADTIRAEFAMQTGGLYVNKNHQSETYRAPEEILQKDDAQAFLIWMDKCLKGWL